MTNSLEVRLSYLSLVPVRAQVLALASVQAEPLVRHPRGAGSAVRWPVRVATGLCQAVRQVP